MRRTQQPLLDTPADRPGGPWDSVFCGGMQRPPSQKELAAVLQVTTRHLRRWERDEAAAGRCCSRPYSQADLWRLYQRRGAKGWDRVTASRVGVLELFERFDQIRLGVAAQGAETNRSMMAAMMLRSMAAEGDDAVLESEGLPPVCAEGLAAAAKAQLRRIVDCAQARDLFVRAFFEAALIAEAKRGPWAVRTGESAALSA